jgi:DNA repair exonuclease SbcCD ATPase subunit
MIIFKKITYKNFKSVGNAPITIDLDRSNTTLITGKNGSGKSTLTSAICFALFGQDFTLNKPGLINSINLKNLEVTIEFEIGPKQYKIHRGIKPNIFKIYENGKLLNEESSTRDYQKNLESQILKMDIRAFKQVVVIGGRSYTPFMKLKPNERREFIEDLLDIRIFSTMSSLLKEKAKTLKEDIRRIDDELKTIKEKTKLQEAFIKTLSSEKSISIDKIEAFILKIENENESLSCELQSNLNASKVLSDSLETYKDVSTKLAAFKQELKSLETKKNVWLEKIKFYETTTTCPTCTQEIQKSHREHIVSDTEHEISKIEFDINQTLEQVKKLQVELEHQADLQKKVSSIQSTISSQENQIFSNMKMIKSARHQIEELKSDNKSIDDEKEKLRNFAKSYVELDKQKRDLLLTQQYQDFVAQVLTDGGIKTKIIKQYIPTINKLINKYLTLLDFFVSFHLDENFDETIKSRHRDTFKYDNFSDGQAARIDLALMFAWRDIAKMRNAVNTNLLFLDEADAAIDGDGSSLLSDLIQSVEKSNIFIISHKGDLLHEKFERVLTFETKNNFTVLSPQ